MARTTVTTDMLKDLAVTTAKVNDLAVTAGKLAADAVTTTKILDANVTAAKLDSTAGVAAASKPLVFGATKNIDTFRMTGKLYIPQANPQTSADTATLTSAQMLSGILVATPTAAAAYTTLTGALLEDAVIAIHPQLTAGDTFDLTIINLGGTGDAITLTAPASGLTIVGDAVITAPAQVNSQGTFRFRYTAADTFIAYRVS